MQSEELLSRLRSLIESQPRETELQAFLEENPVLITALSSRIPEEEVIVSQLPLGADYRVDFAFVTYGATEGTILHLVEIERPGLQLFTNADEFTAEANRAFQQLHDWSLWCDDQRQLLLRMLAPLLTRCSTYHFSLRCYLIAGRRSQVSTSRRQNRLTMRANLKRESFDFGTWDGFLEGAERIRHRYSNDQNDRFRCVVYKTQGLFEKDLGSKTNQQPNQTPPADG